ncbi:efflux RND transporter permease subunit [Chelativorans salis]|uniref:Efflux RND transporter permease subunit n=1 Tax=Chelativorans salis TaxID=2978478 RepID=A0ABT2LS86_9HYPH|nr:efflux RND transporter permease subunit [Chelativorans sp. EGI FJ00035]MCT7377236.1 efflux RND transporter permease subunit [Chelativorans sp. EGI FJ00035]
MRTVIDAAFNRNRVVAILFVMILIVGSFAYVVIPKESAPDVPIPIIYVSVPHEGISPEDAERLLLRPLETELQSIEGLNEMSSVAAEGYAAVTLEFTAGFDADQAEEDVRQAVDRASAELPQTAEEPVVQEVNVALFPVITVMLSGPISERALIDLAEEFQDRLEALGDVLEVDIGGARQEVLEVLVDPTALESYGVPFDQLLTSIQRNNQLVSAGSIDTGAGRLTLKVPGVIEDIDDVRGIPITVSGNAVVTVGDVAVVRRSFEDPTGFARIDGQPAVGLEVKKRIGANIIETVEAVKAVIEEGQDLIPESVVVTYLQDQSEEVRETLSSLQNNVLAAVLLVMIIIVASLGWRNGLLVGLAIPGSFLAGIIIIWGMGYTLNIIVLFSLILVLGMVIDAAVVSTELADRRMAGGMPPNEAYRAGAKRMSWPIFASALTTLTVFFPLLFWTGVVGEFMKFLPITVIIVLTASLAMGLIFIPVLGGLIGQRTSRPPEEERALAAAESGDFAEVGGFTRSYVSALRRLLDWPGTTLAATFAVLVLAVVGYTFLGRGVEFFPEIEPRFIQATVKARDNLSVHEKDALVRKVENAILGTKGIRHIYARTIESGARGGTQMGNVSVDTIGVLQLDLLDWDRRRRAAQIIDEVRTRVADIPGIVIAVNEQQTGPAEGKPIELRLLGSDMATMEQAAAQVRALMQELGGFTDVEDDTTVPGVEWRIQVDRRSAARFGADVTTLGQAVQLLTQGLKLAEYRPPDVEEPVDVRVRFPARERTLDDLTRLTIPTERGQVPITNFVTIEPASKTGIINRVDSQRVVTVEADVAEGELPADKTEELRQAINEAGLPEGVEAHFAGQEEEINEARNFLLSAFATAIALMFLVLVTQLNSIFQAVVVMSAIVFSIAGVLIGLLITGRPFGIVMSGIGVIALGGIVVNNNIVLIDMYNEMRARGLDVVEAAIRTGAVRLRPVLLTTVTDILALMPLVLGLSIDLIGRQVQYGAPSTQYWTELSTTVAGGLAFATFLTLMLTPCMLLLGHRTHERLSGLYRRWRGREAEAAE